ncbi:MAG TPA: hypothetical protein DEP18_05765 [Flavobacteriales bacterium]|nr:hypothetical protein [Flavobacteriales bacterium]HRE73869.1 hypothetical protein [Flavobacteriales bacterium]HRE98404.1 hypothetical protein [Flavobacteriales bacterium]HRJ39735.1 hypothetical protein [Flavobacteriales bacterium]
MKTIFSLTLLFVVHCATAQTTVKFAANSGDSELDLTLSDMNVTASADFSVFKNEMKLTYNVTDQKIEDLRVKVKMAPADIYMTLELARISGKSVDQVVKVYETNRDKGWGVIAKELGIKPGSKEFHELKGNAKNKNEKVKGKGTNNGKGPKAKTGASPAPNNGAAPGKKK